MGTRKRHMPRPARQVYDALTRHLVWLHVKWDFFQQLYCRGLPRVQLMTGAASGYFGLAQEAWLDGVMLMVGRLLGQPRTAGK